MIEPEDEPPICEWCNKPVAMFGDLCAECDNAMQIAEAEVDYKREQQQQQEEWQYLTNYMGQ